MADSGALRASAASGMRIAKRCPARRRRKWTPTSSMSCSESTRRQLHSKSERPSGRRRSRSTPTRAEILTNSKRSPVPMKYSPTRRKGNCTMTMERRESRMAVLQAAQAASAAFSRCSAGARSSQGRERERPSLSSSR